MFATVQPSAVAADSAVPSGSLGSDSAGPGRPDTAESLAVAKARRSGQDVSVPSLTSETSEVVAKPDGRLAATIHTKPVRTRKGGAWRDIDTSLHVASGGAVVPAATLTDMRFSGGGSQPLVRMASAGKELELTWPKPLPAPVVSGSTAEYRSILPDVDLRMTATESGFTQLIVVKTPQAAKNPELDQLRLGMSSADLTVRKEADGSLSMVDKAGGGTVFQAPKPVMFDSSPGLTDGSGMPAAPTAQPKDAAKPKAAAKPKNDSAAADAAAAPTAPSTHAATVDVAVPGDQKSLVLTPDQKLLDAPDTVFPVLIDPDVQAPRAAGWAGISRYWGNQSFWKFSGDFGMGYCGDQGRCVPADVKRVLYAIPVQSQAFVGKHIQDAKFRAWESHAWSCTAQPVDLFVTGRIGSGTTWNNSSGMGSSSFWKKYLATRNDARGYDGCGSGYVEFEPPGLRDAVQSAADRRDADLTLGLKAGSESASAYGQWKRFTDDGYLQVFYNLPPSQPAMRDLSSSPGGLCSSSVTPITKVPQVYARVWDPDGDSIGVQFALLWDDKTWFSTGGENTPPASNTFRASGSTFSLQLPPGTPQNQSVGWAVRAWDGAEWGPWSLDGDPTGCYFIIDTSKPAGPVTTSFDFPGSHDAQAALAWTDGVGRYGTFTIATASTDVVAYQWGLDEQPTANSEVATSGGAARSVRVLMPNDGPHTLTARAKDAAGNAGETTTYYFNVRRGQDPRASWAMNDAAGGTSLASGPAASFPATVTGGTLGAAGHTGTAAALTGDAAPDGTPKTYLSTQSAVLETDRSFTVSAWVNTADPSAQFQSAVSQSGVHQGVTLGLSDGRWAVKMPTADNATDYGWYTASSDVTPVAGQWTHLAGVYDAAARTLTVYVNGKPSPSAQGVSLWSARGGMEFGRVRWRDTYTDAWKGSLDDVRVYGRALSPAESTQLAAGRPVTTGTGAKAVWSLDEGGTVADGTSETGALTAAGDVRPGIKDGVEDTAVHFGANGYAAASRPQVDGTRSFSISAWVRRPALAADDDTSKVAVSQPGIHQPEFSLYYSSYYKKWVFARSTEDSTADTLVRTVQRSCTAGSQVYGAPCFMPTDNEWTHLVGVSDAVSHKIRLYVDGYLVDESDYIQTTPWASPEPLMIGGQSREGIPGEFLGGDIDDVRVFDRIVTDDEARTMVQQRPQLAARWKFNAATSAAPPVSAEDRGLFPASLYGGSSVSGAQSDVRVGTGALTLNGTDGYAQTGTAPLDTGRSFTLGAWAQSAAPPNRDMTVLSLGAAKGPALTVRWKFLRTSDDPVSPGNIGEWQVETVDGADKTTVVTHTFDGSQAIGSYWNHLAVTYDAFSDQLTLFVNGQRENEICADGQTGCTAHVSFAPANQPRQATGGLGFGRNPAGVTNADAFSGQIDDVWAYQGVLSAAGIARLAQGDELDSTTGPAT
ncbi:LamG domain-containing protein [Streptomyces sp. NBC_00442]|uniref:LamG domain-containing protein n=1 Tax=Streptomyces sp. NBC_00442 TaxID=2903651 RepID=UPI002E23139C